MQAWFFHQLHRTGAPAARGDASPVGFYYYGTRFSMDCRFSQRHRRTAGPRRKSARRTMRFTWTTSTLARPRWEPRSGSTSFRVLGVGCRCSCPRRGPCAVATRRGLDGARAPVVQGVRDSLRGRRRLGTVLSFELGLLWPRFMAFSGGIFGLPFSAEGFAFFLEAIFLGLYSTVGTASVRSSTG